MIRVALVGPYPYDPRQSEGGVTTSFSTLVEGLAELPDLEPHVLTFVPELAERSSRNVNSVQVHYLPGTASRGNITRHARERRILEHELSALEPDVVHAQDAVRYGYVCLRASEGRPVIVSVHGIVREEAQYARTMVARAKVRLFGVSLERYCVSHASYLVQPTPYPGQYFGREIRGTIVDVGNPIPDRLFEVERNPVAGRILYSGSVIRRKRLLDLVEALPGVVQKRDDVSLCVAGREIDAEYARQIRARVADLGLGGRVTFLGSLSPDEMSVHYREAEIVVLPSSQETSPMVIGEAMAVGIPVVATAVGGVRHLVDDGVTGSVVDPGDVSGLSRAMARIMCDGELAARMGRTARAHANEMYRASAVAERVRTVYLAALGSTRPSTPAAH